MLYNSLHQKIAGYALLGFVITLFSFCGSDDTPDPPIVYPQLYLNEVMPDNETVIADEEGEHDDWFEIYNPNSEPVDLAGWYISDNSSNLKQYQFPDNDATATTIPARGFVILWADEQPGQGPLHLNFRLSSTGESLFLSGDGIDIIDQVSYGDDLQPETDQSIGRIDDGVVPWQILSVPSPGTTNAANGNQIKIFINEFMAANDSFLADEFGEYDDWVELYNGGSEPVNIGGWYITDDSTNVQNWQIPDSVPEATTIQPGGFILLWADEDPEQGALHIGIKISASGEEIGISADGMNYHDLIWFGPGEEIEAPAADHSSGRISDGAGEWKVFEPGSAQPPTPATSNGTK
jgi:hypothetical protein